MGNFCEVFGVFQCKFSVPNLYLKARQQHGDIEKYFSICSRNHSRGVMISGAKSLPPNLEFHYHLNAKIKYQSPYIAQIPTYVLMVRKSFTYGWRYARIFHASIHPSQSRGRVGEVSQQALTLPALEPVVREHAAAQHIFMSHCL